MIHVLNNLNELHANSVKELIEKERNQNKDCFVVFPHEWEMKSEQILEHIKSYRNPEATKYHARKCDVKIIDNSDLKAFCSKYHIQGSNNLSICGFGIYYQDELLGILSLGRHHRQGSSQNNVILDRMCFKHNVRVQGGASKLFESAKKWSLEHGFNSIISFSDNRWTEGNVYKILGFEIDAVLYPDYFYVKKDDFKSYFSKQSQKKSNTNCPQEITELEWSIKQGLLRVYDGGKIRWIYHLKDVPEKKEESKKTKAINHIKDQNVLTFSRNVDTGDGTIFESLIVYKDGSIKVIVSNYSQESKKYALDRGWKYESRNGEPITKLCSGKDSCGLILSIEEFGTDSSKSDGHSRLCKKCRSKKESFRYHLKKKNNEQ